MVWVEVYGFIYEEDKCTERRIAPVGLYRVEPKKLHRARSAYVRNHPIMKEIYGSVSRAVIFTRTHNRFDIEEVVEL